MLCKDSWSVKAAECEERMALESANSGNYIGLNYGGNPAVNFNFLLRVEAMFDLPCRAVRVFQKENEYELIQEGGLNDYVHMRRKPISKPFTFQVERYVGVDLFDPLANGTELALPVLLIVNRYLAYGDYLPTRCYVFTGCTVMSKEYGELNAEKSGLMVETTTIAYREMACIDDHLSVFLKEKTWEFAQDKNYLGNDNRKAITIDRYTNGTKSENRKADMEERSKRWQPSDTDFKGTNRSAKISEYEQKGITRKSLEEQSSPWEFVKDDFKGKGGRTTDTTYAKQEVRKKDMEQNAEQWEFTANDFKGKGGRTTDTTYAKQEVRKAQMEEMAMKWEMSEYSYRGRNGSTTYSDASKQEVRKAAMEVKAAKWPAKKSAVDVAAFLSKR